MALNYKLCGPDETTGVQVTDTDTGKVTWFNNSHAGHWIKYQQFKDGGGIPDPQFTQEEINQNEYQERQSGRRQTLRSAEVEQLKVLLELYRVGNENGAWNPGDFDTGIVGLINSWNAIINAYENDTP